MMRRPPRSTRTDTLFPYTAFFRSRIVLDYDMRIAEPLRLPGGEAGVDLWPTLDALKNVPALILRGALSDLFSAQTAQQMLARLAKAELVVVSDVGHAPV